MQPDDFLEAARDQLDHIAANIAALSQQLQTTSDHLNLIREVLTELYRRTLPHNEPPMPHCDQLSSGTHD